MRESDSFDDMRTAGTAGCDRGWTRICGVDDRLVPATCSVGPLLRAGFEKRQFTISVRVSTSTGADGRLAAALRMTWARRKLNLPRSEEHTSELQSLMSISYAVFCLKKKHKNTDYTNIITYMTNKEQH